jgi:PAS domain
MGQGDTKLGTQGTPIKLASAGPRIGTSPDIVTSARVLTFYEFWLARCRNGRLPKKADMDPVAMKTFLSGIVLTKVHRDPLDFEYRIIGDEVIARLGNMTGKRVRGGVLINLSNAAYQNYCAVVESKVQQFLEGTAITAFRKDRPHTFSRVHCPLSDDGETVDYIISYVTFL